MIYNYLTILYLLTNKDKLWMTRLANSVRDFYVSIQNICCTFNTDYVFYNYLNDRYNGAYF